MKAIRDGNRIDYECSCGERAYITLQPANSGGKPYAISSHPCLGCNQQLFMKANFNDDGVLMAEGTIAKDLVKRWIGMP